MKKIFLFMFSCLFALGIYNCEETKTEENIQEEVIKLNSESGIIMEASTGKIIFEKDSNKEMAPASMTKIMTLL